jgi:hypothetical protein
MGQRHNQLPANSYQHIASPQFIVPIFFVTSFLALIIGAAMLIYYSLRGITPEAPAVKKWVAVLLTAFGFLYQVIGAWPLGKFVDFPWQWQKQIILNGSIFALILYILGLAVLFAGVVSLYKHSVIYQKKHLSEEEKDDESMAQ